MTLLQPIYQVFFNLIYKVTDLIPEKIRNIVVQICTVLLAFTIIFKSSGVHVPVVLYVILLILIMIFSINKPIEKIKTNKFFESVYYIGFIFMLFGTLMHNVAEEFTINAIIYLFIFPGIYLVWNNRKDYEVLFNKVANGFVISGTIYYIHCILMAPISELTTVPGAGSYFATTTNPNGLGIMALANMLCAIYLYISQTGKKRIWYLIIIGMSFALIGLAEARASLLGAVIALVFWIIYYLRRGKYIEGSLLKPIVVVLSIALIMAISTPITRGLLSAAAPEPAAAFSVGELMDDIGLGNIKDKFENQTADKNSFFTGRVLLWQYYSESPTLLGNDQEEFIVKAQSDGVNLGPHNTTLDFMNQTGVVSAIANLLLQANVMIFVLLALFYKKQEGLSHTNLNGKKDLKVEYYTLIILCASAFVSIGVVEALTKVTRWGITTLFYFVIAPLLSDKEWKRTF